jgi:hypothetical protein
MIMRGLDIRNNLILMWRILINFSRANIIQKITRGLGLVIARTVKFPFGFTEGGKLLGHLSLES